MSCGCWMDPESKSKPNHPENSTVMPNVKTTVGPLPKKGN